MKKYRIDKKGWRAINPDSAKFVLEESKEYLNYTIGESEKITNRAYSLVLLLATVLSAVVGYTFTKLVEGEIKSIIYLNFYFSIIITLVLVVLSKLVFPRKIMAKGRKPRELAKPEFLNPPTLKASESYLAFLIQEIENIQDKIDFNLAVNEKRRNRLVVVMYTIACLLPVFLLIALFFVS